MPGGEEGLGDRVRALLGATSRLVLATGIVNIWAHTAAGVAALHHQVGRRHPSRFLLGLGIGHQPLIERESPGRYRRPFRRLNQYLTELDQAVPPVGSDRRILAAFGPQMLALSRDRASGAHTYLVTPEHTRMARSVLGPGVFLAAELHVVLDTDPTAARAIGREYLVTYWTLPSYIDNFRRMGFVDDDFANGGSDRMVDALVAWGDMDTVVARVEDHLAAGADHVCLQVLTAGKRGFPVDGWRRLAEALRPRLL